jgi:hypothetical protein
MEGGNLMRNMNRTNSIREVLLQLACENAWLEAIHFQGEMQ